MKDQPDPYQHGSSEIVEATPRRISAENPNPLIFENNVKPFSEIELIGLLISHLPGLKQDAAQRVLDYAQRLYDDAFGKKKVYR